MIELAVNGKRIAGWESVDISKSMTSLCGTFSMAQAATRDGVNLEYLPIFPGDKVEILRDGAKMLVGWVDDINPSIDSSSHSIGVSGREVTCDLVDCGILPGGRGESSWRKRITLPKLLEQLLAPFGLKYSDAGGASTGDPFPRFSAEPGDTVFQTIQKACSQRGVLPMTATDGSLILVQGGHAMSFDPLVYGANILKVEGAFSIKDRFSVYSVRGEASTSTDFFNAAPGKFGFAATATDAGVSRYRPKVISGGSGTPTKKAAQVRANWEASTRAAKSGTATVTVRGWAQSNGALWECARLVVIEAPPIFGAGSRTMLISSVRYSFGPGGEVAILSLEDPGAYAPEPGDKPKAVKASKDAWAGIRKQVQS